MRTNDLFRDYLDGLIPMPAKPKPPTLAEAAQGIWDAFTDVFQQLAEAVQPTIKALQDLGVITTPPPTDPRERALWTQLHRGTGPAPEPLRTRGRNNHYRTKG